MCLIWDGLSWGRSLPQLYCALIMPSFDLGIRFEWECLFGEVGWEGLSSRGVLDPEVADGVLDEGNVFLGS